jgi:hypothetical protein
MKVKIMAESLFLKKSQMKEKRKRDQRWSSAGQGMLFFSNCVQIEIVRKKK